MDMLRLLLSRRSNSNSQAMITGSLALTPVQYTILIGDYEAYSTLGRHPETVIRIRTAAFGIHILHFAIALLSEEALEMIKLPLSNAGATALGHTLFHIACLTHREEEIPYNPKCLESIPKPASCTTCNLKRLVPVAPSNDSELHIGALRAADSY